MVVRDAVNQLERRAGVLFGLGASVPVAEELLGYTMPLEIGRFAMPRRIPMPSEMHIEAWRGYAAEAQSVGAFNTLRRRFPELRFPVRAGISQTSAYQAATRNGSTEASEGSGLALEHPDALDLRLHDTPAGTIPILLPKGRADFVTLVQALGKRNEPAPILDSMGACIIAGYVNWDRLHALRQAFEAENPHALFSKAYWQQELHEHILPRKPLYQDTFIILSDGEYSGVSADALGLSAEAWHDASLTLRLEHECTHYLTRRLLASMRNHLLDELIADLCGIVAVTGEYRAEWFLRFLGLNGDAYQEGGRLDLYRGTPALSNAAFAVLRRLIREAAAQLEAYTNRSATAWAGNESRMRLVVALSSLTLEELAAPNSHECIDQALDRIC